MRLVTERLRTEDGTNASPSTFLRTTADRLIGRP